MRHYETIIIVSQSAGEEGVNAIIDRAREIIEGDGGSLAMTDKWGLRKLAYPIRKEPQGNYVHLEYGAVPAAVKELERVMRIDDRCLKFLTVKLADEFDPAAVSTPASAEEEKTEETKAAAE